MRALLIANESCTVALLSVEVLALASDTVHLIRERVRRQHGIVPANILVAATHTHSGPVTLRTFFNENEDPDPCYLERLIQACADSVAMALRNSFEAELGIGGCEVEGVGVNRRDPESEVMDRQAGILSIGEAGKTRAVAIIYGCHPTVLGFANREISGDFPSEAIATIESSLGLDSFAMFFNSAAANISSGHSAELNLAGISSGERTFDHAAALGGRLAQAVLRRIPYIEMRRSVTLETAVLTISLKGRHYPDTATLEAAHEAARLLVESLPADDPGLRMAHMREVYAAIDRNNARRLQSQGGRIPFEIQAISLNGALLLGCSAEVFTETSLTLKSMLEKPVFLICLANGYAGYLPPAEAFSQGGYEPAVAACAPDSETQLLAAAVALAKLVTA